MEARRKNQKSHPIKEQLLSEVAFIRFCNTGYVEDRRRLHLTPEFLEAARKDELILPMFEEPGSEGATPVRYYSPHQLSLVVALRENIIQEGRLSSKEPMAFGFGDTVFRSIMWGPSLGVTVDTATGKPIGSGMGSIELVSVAKDFHNFLRLVHSMPQTRSFTRKTVHRQRHFNGAPSIDFDFAELSKDPAGMLANYGLTVEGLEILRRVIGALAAHIDPLEYWHDYLDLHPQARKDMLKGEALIAQEMYVTTDLLADVLEITTGSPQPPLMRFLHEKEKFKPYLMQRDEYASGLDTSALKACVAAVETWATEKTYKGLVPDELLAQLKTVKADLEHFTDRYGERSYMSGVPRPVSVDDTPLDQLDDDVRQAAESMLERRSSKITNSKYDDFFNSQEYRVGHAIEDKLHTLSYHLGDVISAISDLMSSKEHAAWQALRDSEMWTRPPEDQQRLHDEAKRWEAISNEFSEARQDFHRVYCEVCHKRPAPLHHEHYDSRVSDDPICDDCFKKAAGGALTRSPEEWRGAPGGEWYCKYGCVSKTGVPIMLYRFARRNIISTQGKSTALLRIELEYGRMKVEAKCPNCRRVQSRELDWGWVD